MSNDIKRITDQLAEAFGGGVGKAFAPAAPPPPPQKQWRDRLDESDGARSNIERRKSELFGYDNRPLGLIEASKMPRSPGKPARPPFRLVPSDFEELQTMHFDRSFNFDRFCQEACLPVLVEDHDPDYPAVSRLFLQRKSEAHRR